MSNLTETLTDGFTFTDGLLLQPGLQLFDTESYYDSQVVHYPNSVSGTPSSWGFLGDDFAFADSAPAVQLDTIPQIDNCVNFSKITVSTGYSSGATTIVLSASSPLPTVPFNMVWWNSTDYGDPSADPNVEVIRVTTNVAGTLTIIRGQEGTAAVNHNTAGKTYSVLAGLTAKVINTDLPTYFPGIIHKVDVTGLTGNVANEAILNNVLAGMYGIRVTIQVTQQGNTGTLPAISIGYTQEDSGVYVSGTITAQDSTNSPTAVYTGMAMMSCQAGSSIYWSTSNYASTGSPQMQYSLHIRLEYFG